MPEEVLFEDERRRDRGEIAALLRDVADKLDAGRAITMSAGDRTVTVEPPPRPTFEIKVEREAPVGGGEGELSVEFELEWDEGEPGGDPGSLSVE